MDFQDGQTVTNRVSRRRFLQLAALTGGGLLALGQGVPPAEACKKGGKRHGNDHAEEPLAEAGPLTLTAKNFDHLNGQLAGLSWNQIQQHIGLYTNYVNTLNQVQAQLAEANAAGRFDNIRDLELQLSFALNSVILHDHYFSNLGNPPDGAPGKMTLAYLDRDFGGLAGYLNNLKAVGKKMRGWVITGLSLLDGRVRNYGLDAHDIGTPLWVKPLIVLDVYEHAYLIDFGTNRTSYLDVFVNNLNWAEIETRFRRANHKYKRRTGVAAGKE